MKPTQQIDLTESDPLHPFGPELWFGLILRIASESTWIVSLFARACLTEDPQPVRDGPPLSLSSLSTSAAVPSTL